MVGNIAGLLLPGVTGVGAGVRLAAKSAQVAGKARQATRAGAIAGRAIRAVCSFSAEIVVATKDSPKAISAIKNGDQVLAYHEALGTTGSYTVTDIISHLDRVIVHLTIAGEVIQTTLSTRSPR